MTITLDDELVERAAMLITPWAWERSNPPYKRQAKEKARAAITAYLQGAVDAGKAWKDDMAFHRNELVFALSDDKRAFPALILRLPSQNASSAESSSISEQAHDDPA
jgi:hypothetical protein